jgi:hypothetical protein
VPANLQAPLRKEKRLHRTIEITVPPSYTGELVEELGKLDGVVSLSVARGASVKPEGDVLSVHALNLGADEVSACGALAGIVMLTTYRQYLLPGALIALRVIESVALVGAALVAGQPAKFAEFTFSTTLDV